MSSQEKLNSKSKNSIDDNLYKSIGEVSSSLGIPSHVLRFWESKFLNIKPHKRKGGHRYYSKADVDSISLIKKLLYEEGYTIKGAQKFLKQKSYMKNQASKLDNQHNLFMESNFEVTPTKEVQEASESYNSTNNVTQIISSDKNTHADSNVDTKAVKVLLKELESIKKSLEG